jgi:DNA-3-methyladenine glycosylase II
MLAAVPPFRLDLTVWALRRRPINQVDRWDGSRYCRTIELPEGIAEVTLSQTGSAEEPVLLAHLHGAMESPTNRSAATRLLTDMLGLQIDLAPFYALAGSASRLGKLAAAFRGMKPPKFPTLFEALVNGISCQQISLQAGLSLLNRLAASYGKLPAQQPGSGPSFPSPPALAGAEASSLRALGYSYRKGWAIVELARAFTAKDNQIEVLSRLDTDSVRSGLRNLPGVGRWTADYVLLRGLRHLEVFPGDDVGARNNLRQWLGLDRPLDYDSAMAAVSPWHPYAGLVYFHLLLAQLANVGTVTGG